MARGGRIDASGVLRPGDVTPTSQEACRGNTSRTTIVRAAGFGKHHAGTRVVTSGCFAEGGSDEENARDSKGTRGQI